MTGAAHEQLHAFVHGRVQGVNFRYYTTLEAIRLGLAGWVRNRPDRTVEVRAEGPRPSLEALLQFLHRGPPSARVEKVSVEWLPATNQLRGFDVLT